MSTTRQINWDYAKIQYELFGTPVEDLATSIGVPLGVLKSMIEERDWKQGNALPALELSSIGEAEDASERLVEKAKERLNVLSAIKQYAVYPEYIAIEQMILSKVRDSIANLDTSSEDVAKQLKQLQSIYSNLLQHNALTVLKADALDAADNGLVVQIMNHTSIENG